MRKTLLMLMNLMTTHTLIQELCYDHLTNEGYIATSNAGKGSKSGKHYFIPFQVNEDYDPGYGQIDLMSSKRTKLFNFKKNTTMVEFNKFLVDNAKHISCTAAELMNYKLEGSGITSIPGIPGIPGGIGLPGVVMVPGGGSPTPDPDDDEDYDED